MIFLDQKFEYYIHEASYPSNKEGTGLDFDSKEYAIRRWHKTYFKLLLNEFGSTGWELINQIDDSYKEEQSNKLREVFTLTFKRSSRSDYYGKGVDINFSALSQFAREQVRGEHRPHGELLDKVSI